jgi:hypothetical protein
MPTHARHRPTLNLTVDPDLDARLRALVARLPGATLSRTVDELLTASLPLFEDMADALDEARGIDGEVDERRALQLLTAAIGTRVAAAIADGGQHTGGLLPRKERGTG